MDAINPTPKCPDGRVGDWIQTYSGRPFWPLDPRPEEICIEDIAHALAHQCRFAGHVKRFYSVGEHCVRVSFICDPADALWGLLHDAAEAYLVDLPRPIKRHSEIGQMYSEVERRLMAAVCERFGLAVEEPESVGVADKILLGIEARDLMAPLLPGWEKWLALIGNRTERINDTLTPPDAERRFILRFKQLGGQE